MTEQPPSSIGPRWVLSVVSLLVILAGIGMWFGLPSQPLGLIAVAGGVVIFSESWRLYRSLDRATAALRDTPSDASRLVDLANRLEEQNLRLEEQNRLAGLRAEVGLILNRDVPLPELLTACAESILRQTRGAFVRIWSLSESEPVLELVTSVGQYTNIDGRHARIPMGQFKIGRIAERGEAHLSNDLSHDSEISDPAWAAREGMQAFAGHPLICKGRVVGVMAIFSREVFSEAMLAGVRVVADSLALGIVRKRSEEAVRTAEARQRAIIEAAHDCIVTIDRTGRVIEFNPAAERTFGYSRTEVLGKELGGLIIPAIHREGHMRGMNRYLTTGETRILGQRLRGLPALRKDGTEIPVEITVVRMELGVEPVFTAFLRDITPEVAVEEERKAAVAASEAAREHAEAASRSKSWFLANVSHEFRTPMAAIVGYAEMLLDPRLTVDRRMQIVQAVIRNGRHLLALINDVLDLGKLDAGKFEPEKVSCRLWRVVTEALSVAEVLAVEKGLELEVLPIGRLPRDVTTDPTRLRQIFDNLLSNAVKFTDRGKRIEVRLRLEPGEPTPILMIEVEDQGIGMSEKDLSRIFTPFSQADPSTTRRFGGTGLGLTITKKLIEALGGTISVRSEPGQGSCFTVRLPVGAHDAENLSEVDEFTRESRLVQARPTVHSLSGRVLLAEDNPDNQAIVRYFLERTGLTVELASNGQQAVDRASAQEFDLILMDMQMPELDGYAATSILRQKGYGRGIVALTAHAMSGDEERCLQAGCNAYLSKPVEPDQLIRIVARYLPSRSWTVKTTSLYRTEPTGTQGLSEDDLNRDYRRSLTAKITEIRQRHQEGDRKALGAVAHRIKGSAGMYGLGAVSETAGLLEQACQEGLEDDLITELVQELCTQLQHASEQKL